VVVAALHDVTNLSVMAEKLFDKIFKQKETNASSVIMLNKI